MKLAIVGLGHVAQYQLSALKRIPEITLSDAFDIDSSTAKCLDDETVFHKSLDDLLSVSSADIFLVSTPNVTHFEIAKKIVEAGRPVVIEKPIVSTSKQLEILIELANYEDAYIAVALHAAYARDLMWWRNNCSKRHDVGPLKGFHSGFYDPYINQGSLVPQAKGLGGSWFDSGINALSVVGTMIEPSSMRIIRSNMSILPQIDCDQIQGSALIGYETETSRGFGFIDTNWTLGLNEKITRLFYDELSVTLHHTMETVIIEKLDGSIEQINLSNDLPRLVNHYQALFTDLLELKRKGESNLPFAVSIHRLLQAATKGMHE